MPNNSPLGPTISPLALAAIGRMALVSNLSSTSADVVVQLDTSTIWPMAASDRGEMALVSNSTTTWATGMAESTRGHLLGARGRLLGARGGCGPDLHFSQGRLWLFRGLWRQGWLRSSYLGATCMETTTLCNTRCNTPLFFDMDSIHQLWDSNLWFACQRLELHTHTDKTLIFNQPDEQCS